LGQRAVILVEVDGAVARRHLPEKPRQEWDLIRVVFRAPVGTGFPTSAMPTGARSAAL
jgi:hypothetical protein